MSALLPLAALLFASCCPWIASAERKAPEVPEAAIAAGKESDALLAEIGDMFDEEKGPLVPVLDNMKAADRATRRSAKDWVLKPYEAAKAAGRVVVQSTKNTQNVVMHDALKLDSKIKGEFSSTMSELHPQHLSSEEIQKVVSEHGGERRPMILDDQHLMKGTRVLVNSKYDGPDFRRVQHHQGTITDFKMVDGVPKWKVKLDSGIDFQPELVVNEFEMLPDHDITVDALGISGRQRAEEDESETSEMLDRQQESEVQESRPSGDRRAGSLKHPSEWGHVSTMSKTKAGVKETAANARDKTERGLSQASVKAQAAVARAEALAKQGISKTKLGLAHATDKTKEGALYAKQKAQTAISKTKEAVSEKAQKAQHSVQHRRRSGRKVGSLKPEFGGM